MATAPEPSRIVVVCAECRALLEAYASAVHALVELHKQQFQAVMDGDWTRNPLDLKIHAANERKLQAKYAYLQHLDQHEAGHL